MNEGDDAITDGGANIYADLGFPHPQERSTKASLVRKLIEAIEERGWTQADTARILGLSQPDVSRLCRGILRDVSVERLMHLLHRLGYRVTIRVESTADHAEDISLPVE